MLKYYAIQWIMGFLFLCHTLLGQDFDFDSSRGGSLMGFCLTRERRFGAMLNFA
jgi:hypothetical protein